MQHNSNGRAPRFPGLPTCWWVDGAASGSGVAPGRGEQPHTPVSTITLTAPSPARRAVTNRRGLVRRPIRLRVDVVPVLDPAGLPSQARRRRGVTLDVSASGLRCSQLGYLPVGARVRVFLGLPGESEHLSCCARVARYDSQGGPCHGLAFVGLGPLERGRLARLVNRVALLPGLMRAVREQALAAPERP